MMHAKPSLRATVATMVASRQQRAKEQQTSRAAKRRAAKVRARERSEDRARSREESRSEVQARRDQRKFDKHNVLTTEQLNQMPPPEAAFERLQRMHGMVDFDDLVTAASQDGDTQQLDPQIEAALDVDAEQKLEDVSANEPASDDSQSVTTQRQWLDAAAAHAIAQAPESRKERALRERAERAEVRQDAADRRAQAAQEKAERKELKARRRNTHPGQSTEPLTAATDDIEEVSNVEPFNHTPVEQDGPSEPDTAAAVDELDELDVLDALYDMLDELTRTDNWQPPTL